MVLLIMLALVASATAQETATVVATPVTSVVEAAPRATVTLRLQLRNDTDRRVVFTPNVTPPMGWNLLVPPGEVRLEAAESRLVVFSLLVPAGSEAGAFVFPVTFYLTRDGPLHSVNFTIRVPTIDAVTLTLLEAPAYVVGERFTTRFLLRNDGNSRRAWNLTADSSASLPLEVEPEHIVLDPGAATEVLVHATVPGQLATSMTHVVTLRAAHPERPDVQAVARGTSELIPRDPSPAGAFHTFPLTVRLALEARHDGSARLAEPTVELYGTGPVHDRDPGRFTVRVKTGLHRPFAPEAFLVSYQDANTRVAVGKQAFSRSTLLATETGFGVHAERTWRPTPTTNVTGSAAAYVADAGPAVGAALDVAIDGGFTAGVLAHTASVGSTVTVGAGYRAPVADPTRLELALLEASYALRSTPAAGLGHAFRVHARLREGLSTVDFRYRTHTATFTTAGRHESTMLLRAVLRIDEALHIDTPSPLNLHLEVGTTDTGPSTGTSSREHVRTFGASLTTRFGATHLSVGHRDVRTQRDATTSWEGTSHVQAYLPLGEHASLLQRLSWVRTDSEGDGSRLLYEATGATATGEDGRLTARVEAGLALNGPHVDTLTLGARWAGPLAATWTLQAEGTFDLLGRGDIATLEGEARKLFANEHELELGLGLAIREALPPRATFTVAYAVPFRVPLGPRSNIGSIRGTVLTAGGEPLAGVIVTAAGAIAVTGTDGVFVLPVVAHGRQLVHLVPNTVPTLSPIVSPSSPATVEVRAGVVTDIAFEVTPGATVAGRLIPEAAAEHHDRSVLPPQSDAARWLQGVTVELTDGTLTVRATTDATGAFLLPRVPPGTWILRLHHPSLPGEYRIEPAERQLQIVAGAHEQVEFRLVPVTRTIRFQDGGRLGGGP